MSKRQIVWLVILFAAIIVSCAGGYVAWSYFKNEKNAAAKSVESASTTIPESAPAPQQDPDALNVSSSGLAISLGQLSGGQGQIAGSSTNGPSNTSSSASAPTPDSFKEYEKYKDNASALFGEIKQGTGAEVTNGSKVAMYYKGWLSDGTMFDKSRANADGTQQPFMFTIGAHEVIPGLEEGVYGMKVGGTRRVIIPPALAYGEKGNDAIPPNSLLIFDIQLIAVQ